jgi:predicted MFS family arabinose efflux permease
MVQWSAAVCFFLNAFSFLAVIGSLLLMKLEPRSGPAPRKERGHIREGFRYVLQNRRLKTIFTLFAIVGIFGWSYSVLLPPYATDFLKLKEAGYSLLLTSNGIGALIGALTTAAFGTQFKPRHLAFTGLYLFASMLLVLGIFPNFTVAIICLALAGWGMMLFFSTINTVIQTSVPDGMRGRIMGIWALVFGGMMPLGSLQAGTLSHYFGVLPTVIIGGVVCALAGLITFLYIRNTPPQSADRK